MKKYTILSNFSKNAIYLKNRERMVHVELTSLSRQFKEIQFVSAESIVSKITGTIMYLFPGILLRIFGFFRLYKLQRALSLTSPYLIYFLQRINLIPFYYLKQQKVDAVFAHEFFPCNLSSKKIPIIYDTRMPTDDCVRAYLGSDDIGNARSKELRLKKFCSERSTLISLTSPGDAMRFKEKFPHLSNKVRCVPWYVPNLEPVEYSCVEKKFTQLNPLRILFVGNDAKRKGLSNLLMALSKIEDYCFENKVQLDVVTNFRDGVVKVNIPKFVTVRSNISHENVKQLMKSSHVFIFPTLGDTYGHVIHEAMAAGCVVACSDREPQNWFIDYGKAGITFNPTSPESIINAIKYIVENLSTLRKIALTGYERFKTVYHHTIVGVQMRNLLIEAATFKRI